jgi:translation elongation factor EF-Ts
MLSSVTRRIASTQGRRAILINNNNNTVVASTRSFSGFVNSLQQGMLNRQEKSKDDQFKAQMAKMLSYDIFSLKEFSAELDENLDSWRAKIPGMTDKDQMAGLRKTRMLINVILEMNPDSADKSKPHVAISSFDRHTKRKISAKSGT